MIPLNRLLIRWRHPTLRALPSILLLRHRSIPPLLPLLRSRHIRTLPSLRLAILLPQPLATGLLVVHIVVRDTAPVLALVGRGNSLVAVLVVGLGIERDYVPGVEKAGNITESAEEDVYEAIGGANAAFDPDGDGGEEDGEEAEEDVAAAHFSWCLGLVREVSGE